MELAFFVPMKPPTVTHQEKDFRIVNGKVIVYEPQELKIVRSKFTGLLLPYKPEKKITGPVRLITKWLFPISAKHKDGEWKTTRPDTDNMIKLLKDVMTDVGFWKDDALVASEITEKFWANHPGIYINVEEL